MKIRKFFNSIPLPLLVLFFLSAVLSIGSLIAIRCFSDHSLIALFSLSKMWRFWQPFSSILFVYSETFSLRFLLNFIFPWYWIIFFSIPLWRKGKFYFLILFLGSALFSSLPILFATPKFFHTGPALLLYSVFLSWIMLYKDSVIGIFFALPINAKHLFIGILLFHLFSDLNEGDFFHIEQLIFVVLYSYLLTLIKRRFLLKTNF